ncbi:mitofusin [Ascosphaera acerosa]|nr:mitofusin [Ascosphaera acerosa]
MDHRFGEGADAGPGEGPTNSSRGSRGRGTRLPRPASSSLRSARSPMLTGPPEYLTSGNGQVSEHATSLMASLARDSGYGGSSMHSQSGGDSGGSVYDSAWMEDRPMPPPSRLRHGGSDRDGDRDRERRTVASHILQLQYNQNRLKLSRTITKTIELLRELSERNSQRPAYYPGPAISAASASSPGSPNRSLARAQTLNTLDARYYHPSSSSSKHRNAGATADTTTPASLRRSRTSFGQGSSDGEREGGSSGAASSGRSARTPEPRLMPPELAHELSVLKVDLRVGSHSTADLATLEKTSIASLLESRVSQSIKHLYALRDRIEDTSSKVLITGDLNAGKSTFCNALLRRKILPEDQQPCTSIFCEVLDARENGGIEEVHAVHKELVYDRHDESTYDVFALADLETLVVDSTAYTQCKVYVKDVREIDESLLNNGVVDISIIDAPGLNSDSVKTTAVFARQEEIDVVVFVVSAANHFTLSAQEFIQNAAHEKTYMFIVVNGYDNIRDKKRCQQMVLKQVASLSPRTYKESDELVHFVASNSIPVAPAHVTSSGGSGDDSGFDDGDGSGGEDGDDNDSSNKDAVRSKDKGKGKSKEQEKSIRDFSSLEASLRRFVLEKRSHSKLAPARTYLMNLLSDLFVLASANKDVAAREYNAAKRELDTLIPEYEHTSRSQKKVHEEVEARIDAASEDVYAHARKTLDGTIANLTDIAEHEVAYPGLFSVFQYAEDLKFAMLERVESAVALGVLHVGQDKFGGLEFHADMMYRKPKHRLARQVSAEIDMWDFFDGPALWAKQEKLAAGAATLLGVGVFGGKGLASMGVLNNVLSALGLVGGGRHGVNLAAARRLALPGVLLALGAAAWYVLSEIPRSLPANIQRKVARLLHELDYTHANAARVAGEVRRVLRLPAKQLQTTMHSKTEELARRRDQILVDKRHSEGALKYFTNLYREAGESRRAVEGIDLEALPPVPGSGAMAAVN